MKVAVFWGSKSLKSEKMLQINEKICDFFDDFWVKNVIFWGWDEWIMGEILKVCEKKSINYTWYIVELEPESEKIKDKKHFKTDDERIEAFFNWADIFLALPWGFWTIREILHINELIKRRKSNKKLYVVSEFEAFASLIEWLKKDNMIADLDVWIISVY